MILTTNIKNDGAYTYLRESSFTSSGGTKLFISNRASFESFFGGISEGGELEDVVECIIDRSSLINYMHEVFQEFRNEGVQEYNNVDQSYWEKKFCEILNAEDLSFTIEKASIRTGNRIYIQGDDGSPFGNLLWKVLLPNISKLDIEKEKNDDGTVQYRFKPVAELPQSTAGVVAPPAMRAGTTKATNTIYYGSPGTGKSHKVNEMTSGMNIRRVTFHPEYDYASFVGGYKPAMDGSDVKYMFVPQIFTNIYVDAWKNLVDGEDVQHFFLLIEEINRGNCAEVFGDIFQLLDRDTTGGSCFGVEANKELREYLESVFGSDEHLGIAGGEIRLPNNLSIVATMNTSDQSLYPMDSAFKRRWEWDCVPIQYNCLESNFNISLDNGTKYKWLSFLEQVNRRVVDVTQSHDKQLGNWFVKGDDDGDITEKTFVNKVLFYLWNDVFKDEEDTIFLSQEGEEVSFESLFTEDKTEIIEAMLERLEVIKV